MQPWNSPSAPPPSRAGAGQRHRCSWGGVSRSRQGPLSARPVASPARAARLYLPVHRQNVSVLQRQGSACCGPFGLPSGLSPATSPAGRRVALGLAVWWAQQYVGITDVGQQHRVSPEPRNWDCGARSVSQRRVGGGVLGIAWGCSRTPCRDGCGTFRLEHPRASPGGFCRVGRPLEPPPPCGSQKASQWLLWGWVAAGGDARKRPPPYLTPGCLYGS